MKLLTVCVPCYNAIEFMHKALGSCLLLREDLQVIVIDKNSSDDTYLAMCEYEIEYPETFKIIKDVNDEENVKLAYKLANGLYFKMLDSHDFFDQASLVRVIETIKDVIRVQANLDAIITDVVFIGERKDKKLTYENVFPTDKIFGWHEVRSFKQQQFILSQAIIIKTAIYKSIIESSVLINLDNELFTYCSLPFIKSFCYINMPLYYIGDNPFEEIYHCKNNTDILKKIIHYYDYFDISSLRSRKQRHYMIKCLSLFTLIACAILTHNGDEKSIQEKDELWSYIKYIKPKLYRDFKRTPYAYLFRIEGQLPQKSVDKAYQTLLHNYGL